MESNLLPTTYQLCQYWREPLPFWSLIYCPQLTSFVSIGESLCPCRVYFTAHNLPALSVLERASAPVESNLLPTTYQLCQYWQEPLPLWSLIYCPQLTSFVSIGESLCPCGVLIYCPQLTSFVSIGEGLCLCRVYFAAHNLLALSVLERASAPVESNLLPTTYQLCQYWQEPLPLWSLIYCPQLTSFVSIGENLCPCRV